MSNQIKASPVQFHLPFDSLSTGKEQGKLYQNKDWLYQKYIIEKLTAVKIAAICEVSDVTIGNELRYCGIKTRTVSEVKRALNQKAENTYRNKEWLRNRLENSTVISVAELCDVHGRTIFHWMRIYKLKTKIGVAFYRKPKLYEDKKWLYQKYINEKLTMIEIAELCETGASTINRWLKKHNIKRKQALYKKKKWLLKKFNNGLNSAQIAKLCNVTSRMIHIYFKKHGGKLRVGREKGIVPWNKGKINIYTEETLKKISKGNKGKKHTEEQRKMWSSQRKGKGNPAWGVSWTDKRRRKTLRAITKRPTSPEKTFNKMTSSIVRYVGNKAWWRRLPNGHWKNPDFKVTGQKKVIEIYGDYWHRNDDPQELINLYNQIGLQCLVIWENEVYNKKEEVIERVNKFISS